MENDSLKNLLKRIESGYSLPSLSPVAIKLVEIASDDACSIEELISLIEKDPSLAVNLLKMANSAFFKSGQPVASLQQAIMRIGFHQLRIMGLSMSLRNTFPMGKVGPLDYENFWRISLYRGLIAKSLAQHLKSCNPDEAFVAGLIIEVGFLIFFDLQIKGKTEETIPDLSSLEELLRWEDEHFGVDHRVIGEAALRYWKFPDKIVECQKGYGKGAMDQKAAPLTRVCELARVFSCAMLHREIDFHILFSGAQELYGLSDDVINDIILATFEEVEEIAAQGRKQISGFPFSGRFFGPIGEVCLGLAAGFTNRVDAKGFGKGGVSPIIPGHVTSGDKGDLVAEIGQKRVKRAVGTVNRPVAAQFLRTKHQNPFIA